MSQFQTNIMTTKPTIAFFGATGGCAGATLAAALRDGYTCTALARTPNKLRDLLTAEFAIPASVIDAQLSIKSGDVKIVSDVQQALISPSKPSALVDYIVSGIGGYPGFKMSFRTPLTTTDPTICEDGMTTILSALSSLEQSGPYKNSKKPLLVALSATGLSGKRDVPYLLYPLYHWILDIPHEDKRMMESLIFQSKGHQIRDFVIVKPTLLTAGAPLGLDKVRSGWVWAVPDGEGKSKDDGEPAMGYSIGRTDVGEWIFQEVIKKGGYEGKCASLTY
jgi:hypothetical protein